MLRVEKKINYITPEFTVLHWLNVYGWRYVVRLLGKFNCYTHERLDFLFCTARIVRLCNMGCAEIGKS